MAEPIYEVLARSAFVSITATLIAAVIGIGLGTILALAQLPGRRLMTAVVNTGMAVPTVVVGLVVYGMLSRHGPFGPLGLLYTPQAIVLGEVMLGFPMVLALGAAAVRGLDPRFFDALRTMGASKAATAWLAVREAKDGFLVAVLCLVVEGVLAVGQRVLTPAPMRVRARAVGA